MSIETYHTGRENTFKLSRDYYYVNKPGACYFFLSKNNPIGQIDLLLDITKFYQFLGMSTYYCH